ncbi:MAG TPA: hypothetical protein VK518_10330, partial [Puia sp.]|nr:hypothetical protein [Puia sp.]
AMAYFQDFLSWESGSPDTRYYAQYRLGVIQRFLGSPWPAVEESLLNAVEFDSLRGEATKEIIEHYLKEHQWRNAYIFSSYAVREFFGKCPSNSRSWFIDTPFYLWQVLDYHVPVCLTLRKKDEALQYLKILQQYAWHHPGELDQEVLTRMDQCAAALTCPAQPAATKTLPIKTFTNETPGHETLRTQFHL